MSVTKGQRNNWRTNQQAIRKAQLRLSEQELDLIAQQYAFHCEGYTSKMLSMRRNAATPEQRAETEKLYFATTGKSLQDVLEQRIIAAL
jgi:hypothetical protein